MTVRSCTRASGDRRPVAGPIVITLEPPAYVTPPSTSTSTEYVGHHFGHAPVRASRMSGRGGFGGTHPRPRSQTLPPLAPPQATSAAQKREVASTSPSLVL